MVVVVQGKLGSGKSLDTTRLAVDHLAHGGVVASNISFKRQFISQVTRRRILSRQLLHVCETDDPKMIPIGDRRGRGKRRVMVILDEALNWFASSASASDPRRATWGEWLRQSDKLGQDVYFIAQNFDRAAKWIRELAQVCRDISAIRQISFLGLFPAWYLCPPLRSFYLVRPFDVHLKKRMTFEIHRYDPALFGCYDTSETFGFDAAGSAYSGLVIWPAYHPPIIPLVLCLLLVLVSSVGVMRLRPLSSRLSSSQMSALP